MSFPENELLKPATLLTAQDQCEYFSEQPLLQTGLSKSNLYSLGIAIS